MTGLTPTAHYALNPQLSLWGVVGYGRGELTLTPDGGVQQETALSLSMAALGVEGLLRDGGSEGLTIESSADALWVRTSADAADGEDGTLEGSAAEVSCLRLGLQASRTFPVGDRTAPRWRLACDRTEVMRKPASDWAWAPGCSGPTERVASVPS